MKNRIFDYIFDDEILREMWWIYGDAIYRYETSLIAFQEIVKEQLKYSF